MKRQLFKFCKLSIIYILCIGATCNSISNVEFPCLHYFGWNPLKGVAKQPVFNSFQELSSCYTNWPWLLLLSPPPSRKATLAHWPLSSPPLPSLPPLLPSTPSLYHHCPHHHYHHHLEHHQNNDNNHHHNRT